MNRVSIPQRSVLKNGRYCEEKFTGYKRGDVLVHAPYTLMSLATLHIFSLLDFKYTEGLHNVPLCNLNLPNAHSLQSRSRLERCSIHVRKTSMW